MDDGCEDDDDGENRDSSDRRLLCRCIHGVVSIEKLSKHGPPVAAVAFVVAKN